MNSFEEFQVKQYLTYTISRKSVRFSCCSPIRDGKYEFFCRPLRLSLTWRSTWQLRNATQKLGTPTSYKRLPNGIPIFRLILLCKRSEERKNEEKRHKINKGFIFIDEFALPYSGGNDFLSDRLDLHLKDFLSSILFALFFGSGQAPF